ncbi:TonB-like protein [Leeuwenhoekiella aestuarii]|uniref:TonB-like protein n=1 Tax=Leeuwenhoekiella aestuarii TaxID=2249426 RepID=A0A4Q0NST0_9FLAO|nr:energy transducer TonB [Leeuwenhoekiella aestuarii]RXG14068.1 TonB-like protein [Leeuwenhoekiella aestuarii]RXG18817.1 TonB-like protein [Leeuwenhoekiella aestuarii]
MRLVSKIVGLSFICAILSCASESEKKDIAQLSFEEKVADLEATLAAKSELTQKEQAHLKSLNELVTNKAFKPFIKAGDPNNSFDFDDLGRDRVEFNSITEPPYYNSCDDADMELRRACTEEAVAAYVNTYFNPEVYKNSKVRGRYEMTASFLIDTQGNIQDVKIRNDSNKALSAEAKHLLESLPQMKPGKHKGKPMAALYTQPIIYDVKP